MDLKKVVIFSDGGSRNNPGPAAGGAIVFFDDEKRCLAAGNCYGTQTNNQAEYRALQDAVEIVEEYYHQIDLMEIELNIFLDSELMVKQLNGDYQVKNDGLKPLYDNLQKRLSKFGKTKVSHVKRSQNKQADAMVNAVLDRWGL
jgi:ribonuclease HI